MILLDTNVVSEPMRRPVPDARVTAWLDAQAAETLYLSAVTVAELHYGVARLAPGRRRDWLADQVAGRILPAFAGRILSFDPDAAAVYGPMLAAANASGRQISAADAFIAATALVHGAVVVTRDTTAFAAAGVAVVNPWEAPPTP